MRRREFIALLGSTALVRPLAARAQQAGGMRLIGVLMAAPENDLEYQSYLATFRDALQSMGWVQNRNISMNYRWGAVGSELLQRFARELVATAPDLIVSQSTPTTTSLLQQTRTLPILFASHVDPVGSGLVASLSHPGGNVTGFLNVEPSMVGKWLELLKEIAPRITKVALLFNPSTATFAEIFFDPFKAAAASFGVASSVAPVHDTSELESTVAALAQEPSSGLIVIPDSFSLAHRVQITSLAARYDVPAIYFVRAFTEVGGLLSYGPDFHDLWRRAGAYADRILKGAKPSELPVQAPVKFELLINLNTAKALRLDVPSHLQQSADEVIE